MKTAYGYKLFEQDTQGNLYPLFIGKTQILPINKWLQGEELSTKGFAYRPGWHLGKEVPSAPWLMSINGTYKGRNKNWKRVWAKVEYNCENDYTSEALLMPKKCLQSLPKNGFYFFRESGGRDWIITDKIKIIEILSEKQRLQVLKQMGYDEQKEFEPYYKALLKRVKKV